MRVERLLSTSLLLGLLLGSSAPAEVSVGEQTLIMGHIIEDPEPIGVWQTYRPWVPSAQLLNPSGHARGDGRPDIVEDPDPFGVFAVWAYNQGTHHDIAFSEWDGSAWTATAFIASTGDDELDPRIFVADDDTVYVTWWKAGPSPGVWLSSRAPGSTSWSPAEYVAVGRRPSVAVDGSTVRVLYERDSQVAGMQQDIVHAEKPFSMWIETVVDSTARTERLDPVIHVESGRVWVDWMHNTSEFGCAMLDQPQWLVPMPREPWVDPSWVGVEETRRKIRGEVLP